MGAEFNFGEGDGMERKIGDTFDYEGIRLAVGKAIGCAACVFSSRSIGCMEHDEKITGECLAPLRKDGVEVYFYSTKV
jgi:hypothetical protein